MGPRSAHGYSMKKPAARSGRKSKLRQAVEAGAVPRARRPFQCFVSQNGLQLGAAAQIWKSMSDEEKLPYVSESKRTFDRQREAAGLAVRGGRDCQSYVELGSDRTRSTRLASNVAQEPMV